MSHGYCLNKQPEMCVSVQDVLRALGSKSRYSPPSSLVIPNLRSRTDNPQTR